MAIKVLAVIVTVQPVTETAPTATEKALTVAVQPVTETTLTVTETVAIKKY